MSSYFDEHNCTEGSRPDPALQLARLLVDTGAAAEEEFETLFLELIGRGEATTPPASEAVLKEIPRIDITKEQVTNKDQCPICLDFYCIDDPSAMRLKCKHTFHEQCLVPWLKKTGTCPVCRMDLPTDDPQYEEYKKQKKRAKERDSDIQELHNSMFG